MVMAAIVQHKMSALQCTALPVVFSNKKLVKSFPPVAKQAVLCVITSSEQKMTLDLSIKTDRTTELDSIWAPMPRFF